MNAQANQVSGVPVKVQLHDPDAVRPPSASRRGLERTLEGNGMKASDFSNGLPIEKESVVSERPTEPFWCENLLFALSDPKTDVGFWLHLGSIPNEWDIWEERFVIALPGDEGLLSWIGYYHTPQERKPAGPGLAFKCVEPFRRWKVTFDGFATHVPTADMQNGLAKQGPHKRLVFDLDIECTTPVWDAHMSAHGKGGKGEMVSQNWAKEHYEQMYFARGEMRVGDKTYPINGSGWRDHSRGPRGGSGGEPFGGHVIAGAQFPSGRAFIFSTYWRPDGKITLEGGCVVDKDGTFHPAEVVAPPRVPTLQMSGEKIPVRLRWDGGQLETHIETRRSIWFSMQKTLPLGLLMEGRGQTYVLNFGPVEWDGEVGEVYIERSDPFNEKPPEKIWS